MHFILWIVISGIAGFAASKVINKSGSGMLMDVGLGILGGFVGNFVISRIPAVNGLLGAEGLMRYVIEGVIAFVFAAVIIYLYNMMVRKNAAA